MTEAKRMSAEDLEVYAQKLDAFDVGDPHSWIEEGWPREAAAIIRMISAELEAARATALEEAALIVDGADVSVNHLPKHIMTPNDLAGFLTRRDRKLAAAIRALKDQKP